MQGSQNGMWVQRSLSILCCNQQKIRTMYFQFLLLLLITSVAEAFNDERFVAGCPTVQFSIKEMIGWGSNVFPMEFGMDPKTLKQYLDSFTLDKITNPGMNLAAKGGISFDIPAVSDTVAENGKVLGLSTTPTNFTLHGIIQFELEESGEYVFSIEKVSKNAGAALYIESDADMYCCDDANELKYFPSSPRAYLIPADPAESKPSVTVSLKAKVPYGVYVTYANTRGDAELEVSVTLPSGERLTDLTKFGGFFFDLYCAIPVVSTVLVTSDVSVATTTATSATTFSTDYLQFPATQYETVYYVVVPYSTSSAPEASSITSSEVVPTSFSSSEVLTSSKYSTVKSSSIMSQSSIELSTVESTSIVSESSVESTTMRSSSIELESSEEPITAKVSSSTFTSSSFVQSSAGSSRSSIVSSTVEHSSSDIATNTNDDSSSGVLSSVQTTVSAPLISSSESAFISISSTLSVDTSSAVVTFTDILSSSDEISYSSTITCSVYSNSTVSHGSGTRDLRSSNDTSKDSVTHIYLSSESELTSTMHHASSRTAGHNQVTTVTYTVSDGSITTKVITCDGHCTIQRASQTTVTYTNNMGVIVTKTVPCDGYNTVQSQSQTTVTHTDSVGVVVTKTVPCDAEVIEPDVTGKGITSAEGHASRKRHSHERVVVSSSLNANSKDNAAPEKVTTTIQQYTNSVGEMASSTVVVYTAGNNAGSYTSSIIYVFTLLFMLVVL